MCDVLGLPDFLSHSVPKGPLGLVQGNFTGFLPHSVPKGPLGLVQVKFTGAFNSLELLIHWSF
jgi:hypothetical protein